jgi:predicted ATPase
MLALQQIAVDIIADEVTNVGPALTSFVGRERDLAELRGLLGRAHLLTITGPAGAGKTRLALELVRRDPPIDERWFCDLSEARGVDGVCAVVARAVGVAIAHGKSADDNVALVGRALRARGPAIVILDNFEQLRPHAAMVEQWAAEAPETRFIVTSRVPLGLSGEHIIPLGPLASVDEAVQLFVERARALRLGYDPSGPERAAIAEIVTRLDMLPLAIELAASRIRVLGARQIAEHLERRFALLRGEGGGRQATLRDAIDWSWQLLSPHEQRALAQSSVFFGGFDLTAAEAVLALGDDAPWALDVVQALVEHSLVQVYEARDGELRYRLYESVRAFAAGELDDAGVGARYVAHFAGRAATLRRAVEGRGARRALEDLGLEMGNLFAAHRCAVESGDGRAALECALALAPLLFARGPLTALADIVEQAIAMSDGDPRRPEALLVRAEVIAALARPEESLGERERALAEARRLGDLRLEGRAQASLARHAWHVGRLDRAADCYENALAIHRSAGDRAFEGRSLACLADVRYLQGHARAARDTYDTALALLRRHGDPAAEALALGNLGCLEHDCGHEERARRRLEEARDILVELESRHDESHVVTQLGIVAVAERDVARARGFFARAIAIQREVGNHRHEGVVLAYLGQCEELDGDRDESRRVYERAIGLLHDYGHTLLEGLARAWRGRLEADVDEIDLATRFLDESQKILASVGKTIVSAVPLLCGAHLDLAMARAAEARGDHDTARRLRDTARAVARSVRDDGAAACSGDVREALTRLDDTLREADTLPSVAPPSLRGMEPITPSDGALVISAGGRAFCLPGGDPIDLSTRAAPRRILKALADHRERHPGQALAVEALLEAGWPGERLLAEAGKTRVYTAIATLRRKGLKPYLLRVDEGYLLDPAIGLART